MPQPGKGIQRTENQLELAKLYSKATVFFNPTYEDNFPTTNLEALACGTPVITYKTGGSIEAIDSGTGFVVEQGNINAVKECISIIQNLGKEKYSKTCRMRAEKLYNKKDRFMDYLKLYNSVLLHNNK